MKSIYLCGFMGCGKSHIGRQLAYRTSMKYVDLDAYIIEKQGKTIPEIFTQDGEEYFRQLEADYIKELKDGCVVATGGGALLRDSTAEYARQSGLVFFLKTDFRICYRRISSDVNRPLVVNNSKQRLKDIYNARLPIYKRNSNYTINANGKDYTIVTEIMKFLRLHKYLEQESTL